MARQVTFLFTGSALQLTVSPLHLQAAHWTVVQHNWLYPFWWLMIESQLSIEIHFINRTVVDYRSIIPFRRDQSENKLIIYRSTYGHHYNEYIYNWMISWLCIVAGLCRNTRKVNTFKYMNCNFLKPILKLCLEILQEILNRIPGMSVSKTFCSHTTLPSHSIISDH